MQNKVLILGGYGNFGKYIANTLLRNRIPIILAGRKAHLLSSLKSQLSLTHADKSPQIETALLDINQDTRQYLLKTRPKVAINTCGPFQQANYKIVQDCIEARTNYIDLADGRQFVNGMLQFHEKALENNVAVITGASSVPGLSSAVIEEFKGEFGRIEKIQYGITPGQRTNRGGQATVKGVMGYIGRKIRPYGEVTGPVYGWQGLYAQLYPELGYRLMGNCQVPDLDLFPEKYGIKQLKFSAGTQSKLLHICIWLTSWLIRCGLPLNLPAHSSFLLQASHTLFDPIGTDTGGMHMKIYGTDAQNKNKKLLLKWFIIVRKGHGPNVPVVPAILLARKMCQEGFERPGVQPCVGLVSLKEYLQGLGEFDVRTYVEREEWK